MKFYEGQIYSLAQECVEAVRGVAINCPVIMERKGGVVRIDFCPEPGKRGKPFRKWLKIPEGLMDCDSVQLVYRIFPDWDFCIRDGGIVDCAAYAEMKIASAAIRAPEGSGGTSGECAELAEIPREDLPEEYGFAEHEGACKILVEVSGSIVGDIFVAVSGGKQEEDADMLAAAVKVIMNYFCLGDNENVNLIF